jgi:hypothetical protein
MLPIHQHLFIDYYHELEISNIEYALQSTTGAGDRAALFFGLQISACGRKPNLTNPKISIDLSSAMRRTAEPAWLDC